MIRIPHPICGSCYATQTTHPTTSPRPRHTDVDPLWLPATRYMGCSCCRLHLSPATCLRTATPPAPRAVIADLSLSHTVCIALSIRRYFLHSYYHVRINVVELVGSTKGGPQLFLNIHVFNSIASLRDSSYRPMHVREELNPTQHLLPLGLHGAIWCELEEEECCIDESGPIIEVWFVALNVLGKVLNHFSAIQQF